MKAVTEVGFKKSLLFISFTFFEVFYSLMIFPPLRTLFLSLFGSRIGQDSVLMKVKFFNLSKTGWSGLTVGRECFIGDETLIDMYDMVTLEDQVTIAQRVNILTHLNVGYLDHPLQEFFPKMSAPVVIKSGVVICAGSTILPGVTIGENSLVAAGSVVTKDVEDGCMVAGVPARVVRKLK